MNARNALLGLLWAGMTVALTVTTWLAVSLVAGAVDGDPSRVLSAEAVASAAGEEPPSPVTPHAASSPSHAPTPTHSPAATHSRSPKPAGSPSSSQHVAPSPHPTHTTPHHSSTPKPAPTHNASSTQTKTFAVTGGTVAAACTGSAISLRSAQPADGWRVEVGDRGPEHLEVKFRSGDQETEVEVHCSAGVPVLSGDGSDDGGSDS